jgi:hypothetical protein
VQESQLSAYSSAQAFISEAFQNSSRFNLQQSWGKQGFSNNRIQQDAAEFLQQLHFLLRCDTSTGVALQHDGYEAFQANVFKPLFDSMQWSSTGQRTCKHCNHVTPYTSETDFLQQPWILELTLQTRDNQWDSADLHHHLRNRFAEDDSPIEDYRCEQCQHMNTVYDFRYRTILSVPEIMVIQLPRTGFNNQKNCAAIECEHTLNMTPYFQVRFLFMLSQRYQSAHLLQTPVILLSNRH